MHRRGDAAHALGLSPRAVKYQLARLESLGFLAASRRVPARHAGSWCVVLSGVSATHTARAAGTSPHLRALLREIEHGGSGSASFWRLFWACFPGMSDLDVQRVVFAAGERGRPHRAQIRAAQRRRRESASPAR